MARRQLLLSAVRRHSDTDICAATVPSHGGRVDMTLIRAGGLFVVTAVAGLVGCYLPYLWLRRGHSPLLLLPAALSLAAFAWLLTLLPTGAARTYAAYGGVYIAVALGWLRVIEGERPTVWDVVGLRDGADWDGDHRARPASLRIRARYPSCSWR